jgi:hypothetical protein
MQPAFATIITKNYLAHARTLFESLRRYHAAEVYVLFADDIEGFVNPAAEPFTTLTVSDVLPQSFDAMKFYYKPFEFCNALRPFLHRYLLTRTELDSWIYLDADILVTHALDRVFAEFETGAILLSPHVLRPVPSSLKQPGETGLLKFGVFNSGFLGLRRSVQAETFLDWFQDRLVTHCFDLERDVFVDQLWLNLVPVFFDQSVVLRHDGLNVGYWNLHERTLRRRGNGVYLANGQPLLVVHFSRWSPHQGVDWSYGRPFVDAEQRQIVFELGGLYREALIRHGYETCRDWPYSMAAFSTGSPIALEDRRWYYELTLKNEAPPESPFELESLFRRQRRRRSRSRLGSLLRRSLAGGGRR